jgi:hypothetical protein
MMPAPAPDDDVVAKLRRLIMTWRVLGFRRRRERCFVQRLKYDFATHTGILVTDDENRTDMSDCTSAVCRGATELAEF